MSTKCDGSSLLVFRAGEFDRLRREMLADAPLETACFLLARPARTSGSRWRLIVTDIIGLQECDYRGRTDTLVDLHPTALANAVKRARSENLTLILAHTHPVRGIVGPSSVDRRGEESWVPAVRRRIPDVPHGRLIVGVDSVHAALITNAGEQVLHVVEIGDQIVTIAESGETSANVEPRNHRQVLAFGREGQQRLESLHVAVVGVGGTGSVVVQQLSHLGVGGFTLIDPDAVEESNLNRVVGATTRDIDRPKVDVARDAIAAVQPRAIIHTLQRDICNADTARKLLACDLFFCCTDSHGSRAVLNQLAYQYLLPGIDLGVVIRVRDDRVSHVNGRIQMLTPGEPCLLCGDVLDSEQVRRDLLTAEARVRDRYVDGADIPQPAVISINSAVASLAVTMMLSAVTGIPGASRNQRIRFEAGVVTRVSVAPREGCPVCSSSGVIARGDSFALPGRR